MLQCSNPRIYSHICKKKIIPYVIQWTKCLKKTRCYQNHVLHMFQSKSCVLSCIIKSCTVCSISDEYLEYAATRSFLWWMQDGTPTHCTNAVLAFLNEKFRGWVLSWRTANPRSAHSTDFNLLDFYFWAAAQNQVFKEKSNLIDSLVQYLREMFRRRIQPRDIE